MKSSWVAFGVGLIFALGLGISGMTQPQKVMGFLDIFGNWDPSLMFVMVGAISVNLLVYRLTRRREKPFMAPRWYLPTQKDISKPLLVGAFLFGVGWGLAGFCPGPALVSAVTLNKGVLVFVTSMLAGMILFKVIGKKWRLN